jgi:hypothetical protein
MGFWDSSSFDKITDKIFADPVRLGNTKYEYYSSYSTLGTDRDGNLDFKLTVGKDVKVEDIEVTLNNGVLHIKSHHKASAKTEPQKVPVKDANVSKS